MSGSVGLCWLKISIKSNRYKITNKFNVIYLVEFIGYFIRVLKSPVPGIGAGLGCYEHNPMHSAMGIAPSRPAGSLPTPAGLLGSRWRLPLGVVVADGDGGTGCGTGFAALDHGDSHHQLLGLLLAPVIQDPQAQGAR